jgi:3-hydroxyacyl-[acyl-carrier-protein] dehydratase
MKRGPFRTTRTAHLPVRPQPTFGLPVGLRADILGLLRLCPDCGSVRRQRLMYFRLVDRILDFEANKKIRIVKNLTLAEEYLADHFPTFPVMPGVLMLETLVEAGAWLLRLSDDFAHSVVVLREARNVKYGTFMQPGKSLVVTAELSEVAGDRVTFKGKGESDGQSTVSAKFTVARYNLRDRNPALADVDRKIVDKLRRESRLLRGELASVE